MKVIVLLLLSFLQVLFSLLYIFFDALQTCPRSKYLKKGACSFIPECGFHLLSSSSSSFTRASTLFLDCLKASSSSLSTSCSPDSSSTLAMRSFFTMFRAFLSKVERAESQTSKPQTPSDGGDKMWMYLL